MAESHSTHPGDIRFKLRWHAISASNMKRAVVEDITDNASNEEPDHKSAIRPDYHWPDTEDLSTTISPDAGQTQRVRHDVHPIEACTRAHDSMVADGKRMIRSRRGHNEETSKDVEVLAIDDIRDNVTTTHGNSYHDLCISGDARVHAGNVYNSFYNSFQGPATTRDGLQLGQPGSRLEAATVSQASCALLVALLGAIEQLCLLVRGVVQQDLVNRSLQVQIKCELAVFEDALGRTSYIDTQFIGDWHSFNHLLTRAFRNKEGFWRLANSKYRLCQRSKSDKLLHPLKLPAFLDVFRPGEHVQMSIHFDADEISDGRCGRCGLVYDQDLLSSTVERKCPRCNLMYRSNVISHRKVWHIQGFHADENVKRSKRIWPVKLSRPARDIPGYFHRISIEHTSLPLLRKVLEDALKIINLARAASTERQDPRKVPCGDGTISLQDMSGACIPVYRYRASPSRSPEPTDDEASDNNTEDKV
jgi:hypothetical protein